MSNTKESLLTWAYDHTNISHPKYASYSHPIYVTLTGTLIFLITTWLGKGMIFTAQCGALRQSSPYFGYFLLIYLCFMIGSRYSQNGSIVIYQFLWACNQALLVGAIAMITGDSHLLSVSIVVVSVDQLLWYLDLLGFLIKRKFIIGVAKYIIWPQTTKLRLMTTFHHVWYIPLVLWLTAPSVTQCGLNFQVYKLSCVMSLALALIGRISTPKQIIVPSHLGHQKKDDDKTSATKQIYLNLNLSWQLWKDIKAGFLTKCYEVLPQKLIPVFLSMFWNAGNLIGFLILLMVQKIYN